MAVKTRSTDSGWCVLGKNVMVFFWFRSYRYKIVAICAGLVHPRNHSCLVFFIEETKNKAVVTEATAMHAGVVGNIEFGFFVAAPVLSTTTRMVGPWLVFLTNWITSLEQSFGHKKSHCKVMPLLATKKSVLPRLVVCWTFIGRKESCHRARVVFRPQQIFGSIFIGLLD